MICARICDTNKGFVGFHSFKETWNKYVSWRQLNIIEASKINLKLGFLFYLFTRIRDLNFLPIIFTFCVINSIFPICKQLSSEYLPIVSNTYYILNMRFTIYYKPYSSPCHWKNCCNLTLKCFFFHTLKSVLIFVTACQSTEIIPILDYSKKIIT